MHFVVLLLVDIEFELRLLRDPLGMALGPYYPVTQDPRI
jgi:hypothetical protein